ncbi:D-glucuronyl C5-epimerase family protein [Streptomyces wuyuanensis]|uniref:D-glucuronyl C5-epimerase family protein n=1 Tax=Streptomyces wuyuanensis TaxID=1196353 RepID=UPI00371314E9
MAGKRRAEVGRRRFIRLAGGTAAGVAVAGGGAVTAMATGVFDGKPDPYANMPRSLALSLPQTPGGGFPVPPLPDPNDGGTGSAPDPSTRIPHARSMPDARAVEQDVPTALPFEFKTSGFTMAQDLPEALRPWRNRPISWENRTPTGLYRLNAQGAYLYHPNNGAKGYDHPVGQVQFGLGCITSYRVEKDPTRKAVFLRRAKAQADRLIEKRVEARGAWYFPYGFNFKHEVHSGVDYKAPWYSGMAQGEAISLFVQLAQLDGVTESERTLYMAAAHGAFSSLLRGDNGVPWCVNKDRAGYLWIQEYPFKAAGTGDYTYNGMVFAMFGLWDYFQATGNELAAQLYDGACTTMARYFPLLRNARGLSYYCQTHRITTDSYHPHHIVLWRQLHWQTNSVVFANQMDQLIDDFPPYVLAAGATIAIAKGTHTLYKIATKPDGSYDKNLAAPDKILSTKKVTFSKATSAPASMRRRIKGAGIWYQISAGAYKGYWIGEAFPNAFLRGEYLPTDYRVQRTLTFRTNTDIVAYKFGVNGATGTTRNLKYATATTAAFDRRSIVNGRAMCRISAGELAGYWVPANQVIADGA